MLMLALAAAMPPTCTHALLSRLLIVAHKHSQHMHDRKQLQLRLRLKRAVAAATLQMMQKPRNNCCPVFAFLACAEGYKERSKRKDSIRAALCNGDRAIDQLLSSGDFGLGLHLNNKDPAGNEV